jgi:hypothetical protein
MTPWMVTELAPLAYLDPGTGSYALQLIMAGVFGGMFALKQSWGDLKGWASARFGVVGGGSEGRHPSRSIAGAGCHEPTIAGND